MQLLCKSKTVFCYLARHFKHLGAFPYQCRKFQPCISRAMAVRKLLPHEHGLPAYTELYVTSRSRTTVNGRAYTDIRLRNLIFLQEIILWASFYGVSGFVVLNLHPKKHIMLPGQLLKPGIRHGCRDTRAI